MVAIVWSAWQCLVNHAHNANAPNTLYSTATLQIVFSSVGWIAMAAAISLSYFHENNVFHRGLVKYKFLGHSGGLNENGLKKLKKWHY